MAYNGVVTLDDVIALNRKPTVTEVLPLVNAYLSKPGNFSGGSLHIVLDDGNVDDRHVEHCGKWASEKGDEDGVKLAAVLMKMSRTQRTKLYEKGEGTYNSEGPDCTPTAAQLANPFAFHNLCQRRMRESLSAKVSQYVIPIAAVLTEEEWKDALAAAGPNDYVGDGWLLKN